MAFHGKVALVTGAGSGMGRIEAQRLAQGGAEVAVLDVNEAGLEETAAGYERIHCYACDVTNLDRIKQVVSAVESELGTIDRLVHAAAIMPTGLLATADPEWVKRLMRVNYEGTVNMVLTILPAMLERHSGDIIVYGSVAGSVLAPHLAAYGSSKAAVNAFMETLIHENLDSGVRIMLACPPMVNTPLIKQAQETSNPRSIQQGMQSGRFADPEDIVTAVEEGLEKGVKILLPTREARFLMRLRRFAPGLLWKMILKAEYS
jgi:NAD(P)-dependent dehydrogenase (short-subunit alcohol dehydrogenase family)